MRSLWDPKAWAKRLTRCFGASLNVIHPRSLNLQADTRDIRMGLRNLKCDRCQEPSDSLFRLSSDLEKPAIENPWYCPRCMHLMGEPLDSETLRIAKILRQLNWRDED